MARVAVLTGGHSFQAEPFFAIFDALVPGQWTHVPSPDASEFFARLAHPEETDETDEIDEIDEIDVVVFYDMPGIHFTRSNVTSDVPATFTDPSADVVRGFHRLMERGVGMVFLHHAAASWPTWNEYAEIVGARFHYQPGVLSGVRYPDSGYALEVAHHVSVVDQSHPVCAGLGAGFDVTDEVYCFPVFTHSIVPMLRTSFPVGDSSLFSSADRAIRGNRNSNEGWSHPPGSDLVGWVKSAGVAPVVYLQCGDGPKTYANESFRRVLSNAIYWAASDEARTWAASRTLS